MSSDVEPATKRKEETASNSNDEDSNVAASSSRPKRKATNKSVRIDSDSSDGEKSDDAEYGKPSKKKKKAGSESTDADSSRLADDDQSQSQGGAGRNADDYDSDEIADNMRKTGHPDGYDSEFYGDDEDRDRLEQMTEKDREAELFKRLETRELLLTRYKIKKKLEKKTKSKDNPFTSDEDDENKDDGEKKVKKKRAPKKKSSALSRDDVTIGDSGEDGEIIMNPSELREKESKASALKNLQDARKKKLASKTERENKKTEFDALFGDSESESEPARDRNRSDTTSDEESSDNDMSALKRAKSSSDSDEDDRRKQEEERKKKQTDIDLQEHLEKMRLSRHKLSLICHAPFFKSTVIGCYVRIGIGYNKEKCVHMYRIAEIKDVCETGKIYDLERTRTNKGLKLRVATEERVFRMNFISNSPFTETEWREWHKRMSEKKCKMPSIWDMEQKEIQIHKAINHNYTEDDLSQIVALKQRFRRAPTNYAIAKVQLQKQLEKAEAEQDYDAAAMLRDQIEALDEKGDMIKQQRDATIKGISTINRRNREKMKEMLNEELLKEMATSQDDPFTRKSGMTKVFAGKRKEKIASIAAAAVQEASNLDKKADKEQLLSLAMASARKSVDKVDEEALKDEVKRQLYLPKSADSATSLKSLRKVEKKAQQSLSHETPVKFLTMQLPEKLDLSLLTSTPIATTADFKAPPASERKPDIKQEVANTSRRSLNLADYKKKRGLV